LIRNSISMSTILLRAVKLTRIRGGRGKSAGVNHQIHAGIQIMNKVARTGQKAPEIRKADTHCMHVFKPVQIQSGKFEYDIKTAGAISLVF
jgi:RNA 3'-terminal phosphate cyclase